MTDEYKYGWEAFVLTTDSSSSFFFMPTSTMRSFYEAENKDSMLSVIASAMPTDLRDYWNTDSGYNGNLFAQELIDEFYSEHYPSWLASLPEAAQTYFRTRWLSAVQEQTDLWGSSISTISTALVLTNGADGVATTVRGRVTLARSQSWHYMSVLEEAVPAAVLIMTDYLDEAFATAVYSQFTSGTAPPWFKAMPTDVQSFVVLEFLPKKLKDEPMTLDMLALASPAARPTSTPASTSTSTPSATNDDHSPRVNVVVITGVVVPVISLALIFSFAIWFFQRRKSKRAKSSANTLPPFDPERAMRRWSETTFSIALPPQDRQSQSMNSPQTAELHSPGSISHPLRRALSESDLENVSSVGTKGTDPKSAASHEDRAELEAVTSPLVRC